MSLARKVDEARKAVAALVVPGLIALGGALLDGSAGGTGVTASEWVLVSIAALGTGGVVYGVANGRSPDPDTSTPDV